MKKLLMLVLVLSLALGIIPAHAEEAALLDDGMTYATGLPITKEVITVEALIGSNAIRPDMDTSAIWDWLEEKTNIRIVPTYKSGDEDVATRFAVGLEDLPDMLMGITPTSTQFSDAIEAGWIVNMEDYFDLMPSVKAFFDRNPIPYALSKTEGALYSMPYMDLGPFIRDSLILNTVWMKDAGVEKIPSTIEEFTDAMRAIRAASGTGSIPEDCHPIYFKYANGVAYGELDLIGQWGVPVTSADYLAVIDGEVVYQAVNPAIKEPLKWLQSMYKEGLIMPEGFTDDWNSAISRMQATPAAVGFFCGAMVYHPEEFTAIPALEGGKVRPAIRAGNPKVASILFSDFEYPAAIARLYEYMTSDVEASANLTLGMKDVIWHFDENNLVHIDIAETDMEAYAAASKDVGMVNTWMTLRDDESWYSKIYNEIVSGSSTYNKINIYDPLDQVLDDSYVYYGAAMSGDDKELMDELATEINNFRKTTFAQWITTDVDIDAAWDDFVAEMEALDYEEWLELKQLAYDMLMK